MKSFLAFSAFITIAISSFAQFEKINCIIFIDGKFPRGIYESYFELSNKSIYDKHIDFDYGLYDIYISQENKKILDSLPKDAKLIMNILYESPKGIEYHYKGEIRVEFLYTDYLIIRITNLKKKDYHYRFGDYYFGYYSPYGITPFIPQEYPIFEKGRWENERNN